MRSSFKAALAAITLLLGLAGFASVGEARTIVYGGGDGFVAVRDHGYRDRGGYFNRHGFLGDRRYYRHGGPRRYLGGPGYYRHGGFYRNRGYYGRGHYGRRFYGGPGYYGGYHHYRGNGVVIRLR